ncbi:MAG TPA: chemotaxis protein CheW [Spirochaetia bacterium]|nr:chemotaxis protein CheW [Spirochaetia bacterium]
MKSLQRLLEFEIDGSRYALRFSIVVNVVPAVEVTPLPKAPDIVAGVVDFHGRVVPVVSLRRRFNLPDREMVPADKFIIARTQRTDSHGKGEILLVLVVDAVNGVVEVPKADISAADTIASGLEQIDGVVQVAGGLLLIHDLDRCLSLEENRMLDTAMGAVENNG